MADTFVDKSTAFFKNLQKHPGQTEKYGAPLLQLSSLLGLGGIKTLARHNLIIKSGKEPHLLWSNVPYKLKVTKDGSDVTGVDADLPIENGGGVILNRPTMLQIDCCYMDLLVLAVKDREPDDSFFAPAQIRSLIRLCNFKLKQPNKLTKALTKIKELVQKRNLENKTGSHVQEACQLMLGALGACGGKNTGQMLDLVQNQCFHRHKNFIPLITGKSAYIKSFKNVTNIKLQEQVQKIDKIPDGTFITIDQDYRWNALKGKDLIDFINALIYYLK